MTAQQLTLQEINALDQDDFVKKLSVLFEGPPWIVAQAWHARPFRSLEHLHQGLCAVMYNAPVEQQVELLQAHPDLVGRAALAGTLTPASTNEQAAAGLDRLSPEEIATFSRSTHAYRDRFGFPFVICPSDNKQDSILPGFDARFPNSRDQATKIALDEASQISC